MEDDSMERGGEAAGVRRGGTILCCGRYVGGGDLATSGEIAHTYLSGINFGGLFVPLFPRNNTHIYYLPVVLCVGTVHIFTYK